MNICAILKYLLVKDENCNRAEGVNAMGLLRNGARTFLTVMAKACQLSRIPGFNVGLRQILGTEQGNAVIALWEPLCALIDTIRAADNYFNQIDRQDDDGTGEDDTPA